MNDPQGCISMLDQVGGFQCFIEGKGNAGIILQMNMMHMAMSEEFWRFKDGFSMLVHELETQIKNLLGDWGVMVNQKLVSIDLPNDEGGCRSTLTVFGPAAANIDDDEPPKSKMWKVKASEVILTVPRKALNAVQVSGAPFPRALSDSVVDVNMTKINLYFSYPWWNKPGEKLYGSSSTNLPIAQVYPFYQKSRKSSRGAQFKDLCALTIYSDVQNSGFWSDLQCLPGSFTSEFQSEPANKALVPASLEVVNEVLRELKLLFNIQDIPYPVRMANLTCSVDS